MGSRLAPGLQADQWKMSSERYPRQVEAICCQIPHSSPVSVVLTGCLELPVHQDLLLPDPPPSLAPFPHHHIKSIKISPLPSGLRRSSQSTAIFQLTIATL